MYCLYHFHFRLIFISNWFLTFQTDRAWIASIRYVKLETITYQHFVIFNHRNSMFYRFYFLKCIKFYMYYEFKNHGLYLLRPDMLHWIEKIRRPTFFLHYFLCSIPRSMSKIINRALEISIRDTCVRYIIHWVYH